MTERKHVYLSQKFKVSGWKIKIKKETEGLVGMIYRNFLLPLQKLLSPPWLPRVLQNGNISSLLLIILTTPVRKLQSIPDNSQVFVVSVNPFCLIWHETHPSFYQGQIILLQRVSLSPPSNTISRDWFFINLGFWPLTRHSQAALTEIFGWKTRVGCWEMSQGVLPLEAVNNFTQPTPSRIS